MDFQAWAPGFLMRSEPKRPISRLLWRFLIRAALIKDMKARGLLEDTLVLWTTEFGRMPTFQKGASGRDHNPKGFTVWLAGAGVKRGFSYGATDEFGYQAVDQVTSVYDLHATVLHLLGLDHERLSFYHNGIERRLTDVHGQVL